MFNLPPNDERLCTLTEREALEQILMVHAAKSIKAEWEKEKLDKVKTEIEQMIDPTKPMKPVVKTVIGLDAEKIADEPRLTGDPEWDAVELAETNPNKEPIDKRRYM